MQKQSPKRLRAIAHHEAGHVVAAHRAGRDIRQVQISAEAFEDGSFGKTQHLNPIFGQELDDGDPRLTEYGDAELIIALAGPEAESRLDPKRTIAPSDQAEVDRILGATINLSQAEKEKYLRWARRVARQIVEDDWPAIQRVAAALLEHGSLSGDEVAQLTPRP